MKRLSLGTALLLCASYQACKPRTASKVKIDEREDNIPQQVDPALLKENLRAEFTKDYLKAYTNQDPKVGGSWGNDPLWTPGQQAVHVALLPNGKVLIYNGSSNRNNTNTLAENLGGGPNANASYLDNMGVFDPKSNSYSRLHVFGANGIDPNTCFDKNTTDRPGIVQKCDMFCSNTMHLENGNVAFFGGTGRMDIFEGSKYAWVFDWEKGGFKPKSIEMEDGHWYPTPIELGDGRIVVLSGFGAHNKDDFGSGTTVVEVYDPSQGACSDGGRQVEGGCWYSQDIKNVIVENSDPYQSFLDYVGGHWDNFPRAALQPDGRIMLTGDGAGWGFRDRRNASIVYLKISPRGQKLDIKISGEYNARFNGKFIGKNKREEWLRTTNYQTVVYDPRSNNGDFLRIGGHYGSNYSFRPENTDSPLERTNADYVRFSETARGTQLVQVPDFLGDRYVTKAYCDNPANQASFASGKFPPHVCRGGQPNDDRNLDGIVMQVAIALPTQQVLIMGGGNYSYRGPSMHPYLMTPDASNKAKDGWRVTRMNPQQLPRHYHTNAILLPDARVLLAGGNNGRANFPASDTVTTFNPGATDAPVPADLDIGGIAPPESSPNNIAKAFPELLKPEQKADAEKLQKATDEARASGDPNAMTNLFALVFGQGIDATADQKAILKKAIARDLPMEVQYLEVFSPPYLHQGGARPVVALGESKNSFQYGEGVSLNVTNPSKNYKVTLAKLGTGTHGADGGQRIVKLQVTGEGKRIHAVLPPNGNYAPPGYYMMFYVDERGVPSESVIIQIKNKA